MAASGSFGALLAVYATSQASPRPFFALFPSAPTKAASWTLGGAVLATSQASPRPFLAFLAASPPESALWAPLRVRITTSTELASRTVFPAVSTAPAELSLGPLFPGGLATLAEITARTVLAGLATPA